MDILLIRHGERDRSYPEEQEERAPLTQDGKDKVDCLKDQLTRLNLNPDFFLTSTYKHAKQTAERLSDGRPNTAYGIGAITPCTTTKTGNDITSKNIFGAILEEAKEAGVDLSQQVRVAVVGHKPRLDYLLESLTSSQFRSLDYAEAVRVKATALSDFLLGKGKVDDQDWIHCPGDKPTPPP